MCDASGGPKNRIRPKGKRGETSPPGSSSPAPFPSPRCNRRCTNSTSRFLSLPPLLPSGLQFLKAPPKKGLFPFSFVGAGGKREVRRRRRRPPTWKIAQCAERTQLSFFSALPLSRAKQPHSYSPEGKGKSRIFLFPRDSPKGFISKAYSTTHLSYFIRCV